MKLTSKQLKEARSIAARKAVNARWAKTSKEERSKMGKRMAKKRWDKKKVI